MRHIRWKYPLEVPVDAHPPARAFAGVEHIREAVGCASEVPATFATSTSTATRDMRAGVASVFPSVALLEEVLLGTAPECGSAY